MRRASVKCEGRSERQPAPTTGSIRVLVHDRGLVHRDVCFSWRGRRPMQTGACCHDHPVGRLTQAPTPCTSWSALDHAYVEGLPDPPIQAWGLLSPALCRRWLLDDSSDLELPPLRGRRVSTPTSQPSRALKALTNVADKRGIKLERFQGLRLAGESRF